MNNNVTSTGSGDFEVNYKPVANPLIPNFEVNSELPELPEGWKWATSKSKNDNVNHPSHYTKGKIECIEVIAQVTEGLEGMDAVDTAQVLKYIWRWKHKNGLEDLKKAKWYLEDLIKRLEK